MNSCDHSTFVYIYHCLAWKQMCIYTNVHVWYTCTFLAKQWYTYMYTNVHVWHIWYMSTCHAQFKHVHLYTYNSVLQGMHMVTWVHKGLYWYVCMYIVMHVDLDGPCAGAHSQKSMLLCTSRKSADFETFTVMPYSKSRSALTFWEILVQPSRSID